MIIKSNKGCNNIPPLQNIIQDEGLHEAYDFMCLGIYTKTRYKRMIVCVYVSTQTPVLNI
jgi:hypothetical protein